MFVVLAAACTSGAAAQTVFIPPALDASQPVTLTLLLGEHSFDGGPATRTLAAHGAVCA
jgi:hypothetical protein